MEGVTVVFGFKKNWLSNILRGNLRAKQIPDFENKVLDWEGLVWQNGAGSSNNN